MTQIKKYFYTIIAFVILLGIFNVPLPAQAFIFRLSLADDNPTLALSQTLTLHINEAPDGRTRIFVEFIDNDDGTYKIKILPSHITINYSLKLSNQNPTPTILEYEDDNNRRYAYPVTNNRESVYGDLQSTILKFTFVALEQYTEPITQNKRTVSYPGNKFSLSMNAESLITDTVIDIEPIENMIMPPAIRRITPVYQFNVRDHDAYNDTQPITVKLYYDSESSNKKTVYYYDGNEESWLELPSYNHIEDRFVRAVIHLPFARLAIFEHDNSEDGIASWYSYRDCLCAASRDYPKGSKLLITRLLTGKQLVITVNDYGPEVWTGRLIDLDAKAFQAIGNLSAGLIYVNVEPYD